MIVFGHSWMVNVCYWYRTHPFFVRVFLNISCTLIVTLLASYLYGKFRGVHLVDQTGNASKVLMTMTSYFLLCPTVALHSNHFLH